MAAMKTVFIAFAKEDEFLRDALKGQSLNTKSPFEFIDMSVKEAYKTDWQTKVRTRIRRSHGVLAIVTKNSLTSRGQKWEIQCAKEERRPLRGIWGRQGDRTILVGVNTKIWNWANIAAWIDGL